MRFLRAAPHVRIADMEKCVKAYPYLGQLASAQDPLLRERSRLERICSHAVELARQDAINDLSVVENAHVEMDEQIRQRKERGNTDEVEEASPWFDIEPSCSAVAQWAHSHRAVRHGRCAAPALEIYV